MPPRQRIRARARDLLRRDGRRRLPVRAAEVGQRLLDVRRRAVDRLGRVRAHDRARFGVAGLRLEAEPHAGEVLLLVGAEELREPGRAPDEQHEHAGGERVQRARVSDALDADRAPRQRDDVMRRGAGGLVDDEGAVH